MKDVVCAMWKIIAYEFKRLHSRLWITALFRTQCFSRCPLENCIGQGLYAMQFSIC